MDKQKRFTGPFLLALALHLTLLGLFVLSALYKPKVKEPEPVPEIIHATMIDTASLQAEAAGQVAQQPNEAKASQKDVAPLPLPVVKAKLGKMGRGQLLKLDALVAKAERAEQLNGEWAEVEQILKGRT